LNRHLFPPPDVPQYRFILSYLPVQVLGDSINSEIEQQLSYDYMSAGNMQTAVIHEGKSRNLNPDYKRAGNMQTAVTQAQKSVNLNTNPINLFNLGHTYEVNGNSKKAEEYYYKAVSLADTYYPAGQTHDPNDKKIYLQLTQLLLSDVNYVAAEKITRKGVQYFPDVGVLWAELALSEYKLQNQNEAIDAATKAKTLAPNDVNNYLYTSIVNGKEIPSNMTLFIVAQNLPPGFSL